MSQHADTPGRGPFQEEARKGACIKVVSVGGGGNNAINRMIDGGLEGVQFISANTDLQSLSSSRAQVKLQLGAHLTHGLGAGADSEIGQRAALDESRKILESLTGADMVFITVGLGGGTGTGAAPVIASIASGMGALTVAIVTLPFAFEGRRRMNQAKQGLQHLLDNVDTLIVIPNDRLLLASAKDMGFFESFQIADDVLRQAVQGISDIITVPGVINRDFADVRTTMAGMGYGMMGTASRSGPNRASEAAQAALASPLLAAGAIAGARGILINIAGSQSLKLSEVHAASMIIQQAAHEEANIIFGAVLDDELGTEMKVTVIATGFHQESRDRAERLTSMRSKVEQPAVYVTTHPQTPPPQFEADNEARDLGMPESHSWPSAQPSQPAIAAEELAAEISPPPPNRPAARHQELEQTNRYSAEDSAITEVGASQASTESSALDDATPVVTSSPYDEDLLACLEGLPFGVDPQADRVASSIHPEAFIHPEIARIRERALAAYAAVYKTDDISLEPTDEAASFAEVLQSRQEMYSANEHGFIQPLEEEEDLGHPDLTTPDHTLTETTQPQDTELARGFQSTSQHITEIDAQPTRAIRAATADPSNDNQAMPLLPVDPVPSDDVHPPQQNTKIPTPDFNRKLNREPDFSMGLKAI